MEVHEQAEISADSPLSKVRFSRCSEAGAPGGWAGKLTAHELLQPPNVEFHVLSALLDPNVPYPVAKHPLALSHKTVLATHAGALSHADTCGHAAGTRKCPFVSR